MAQIPKSWLKLKAMAKTCSSYTENLTDGCWSPTRPSVFFTARQDGVRFFAILWYLLEGWRYVSLIVDWRYFLVFWVKLTWTWAVGLNLFRCLGIRCLGYSLPTESSSFVNQGVRMCLYHKSSGQNKIEDVKPFQVSDHAVNVVKVHEQVRGLTVTQNSNCMCVFQSSLERKWRQAQHSTNITTFNFQKVCLVRVGFNFQFLNQT